MFMPKGTSVGVWALESKSDARWNIRGKSVSITSIYELPQECEEKIRELSSTLGKRPDDLVLEITKERKLRLVGGSQSLC